MPKQHGTPLPPEAREAIKEKIEQEDTPADPAIYPAAPGTAQFALAAKLRFEEKLEEFKKEMGPAIFDKQCSVVFLTAYDRGTGTIDVTDGNTNSLLMLLAVTVHRLAEAVQKAQEFLPKRDSHHKTIMGIIHRLAQLCMAMMPDNTPIPHAAGKEETPPPAAPKNSGIIIDV